MNVLVVNCGSSSLKFQVIATDVEAMEHDTDRRRAWGAIERIGSEALVAFDAEGRAPHRAAEAVRDHRAALDLILGWLTAESGGPPVLASPAEIDAVGHRVVHGGEKLSRSVLLDAAAIAEIEACIELAPLHNPANLRGIRAARDVFGAATPQVGVFDTSFHASMPESSFLYAIPYSHYVRHRVRRYGFHGTSHRYVAYRWRKLTGRAREDTKLITLHLGNGCSACAIVKGQSFDTSMGLTPLEGLVMGTRAGSVDPGALLAAQRDHGLDPRTLEDALEHRSGLLALSGRTADMRELVGLAPTNERAALAIGVFERSAAGAIAAAATALPRLDAVIFTGGIGENATNIRASIVRRLASIGVPPIDDAPPANADRVLVARPVAVLVVFAREDAVIARDVSALTAER
jgi:acetate kinase